MPLSPRDTIVFIVCVAVPSILCVYLTAYLRFFSPRRSDKLASHASRIADLFFITQLFVPATVLALGVWLSIEAIKLQDNPNTTKEQLNNLAIAGFKVDFFDQLAWVWVMWAIKADFVCKYIDLQRGLPKPLSRVITATWITLLVTFIGSFGINLLYCLPMQRNWSITLSRCSAQTSEFSVAWVSVWHLVTEIMVLVIPILIFRHIPLKRKDLAAFFFIFALGLLTVGAGATGYAFRIEAQRSIDHIKLDDATASFIAEDMARVSKIRLASIAEASCGLFVLSMPSLRVLFRKKTPNEITPITVASYDGNIEIGSPTLWGKTQSTKLQGGKYHPFVEMNPVKPPALRSPRFSK